MSATSIHNPTGRLASEHPGVVRLAKAGWLAKGIVYAVAGVLILLLAGSALDWTNSSEEASPNGALKEIAQTSWGPALLWILAIGLLLYALWRVISAFLPSSGSAESWARRVGYLASAVLYGFLAFTAIALAGSENASADGNQKITDTTQRFMDNTAGRWAVGLAGAVLIGVGLYRIGKGLKRDVDDELDLSGMAPERARLTRTMGAVGEIGRGLALGLIGFFIVRAAWTFNAAEATGLDGSLRRLTDDWWGILVIAVVGLGFVAYGVFCATTFTRRRLESA